jgi:hypothetical protein
MSEIILPFLDFFGTLMVITAAFIFSSEKATKPQIRLKAFSFFLASNIILIPMGILLNTYWFVLAQCVLLFTNVKGIIVSHRIKNLECKK